MFKNGERDEYYFKAMPLADVGPASMSEACFSTREAAWKSATKKHSFVKMLVKICQAEYLASTENVSSLPVMRTIGNDTVLYVLLLV